MLGAPAALHAGIGLQRVELRNIFTGVEPEIVVADKRRNLAELVAFEEYRDGAEHQVQMLGVGNERQENEQGKGMCPPYGLALRPAGTERGQVRQHEQE